MEEFLEESKGIVKLLAYKFGKKRNRRDDTYVV